MWDKVKWLARFYRRYPHVVAILILLTPLQAALAVVGPRMVGFTIDYLKSGAVPEHALAQRVVSLGAALGLAPSASFAAAFVALGLVAALLYAYFQSWRAWMNVRLEWSFRQDAFDGITGKGPDFFNRFRTGDLVTRMTDDVQDKLSWFACSGIFRLYEALLAIGFVVAMMINIDPPLTLWTAGPLPLLVAIFFRSSALLDRRYDVLQKRISTINDVTEACFSGIRVVKAYVREKAQMAAFGRAARDRRQAEIDAVRAMTVIDSLYNYIWQFGVVIVVLAGGYRVLHSGLSLGDLAAFIYYVTWLVFPMFDVGQFLVKSRQSAVSIGRLMELEQVPPLVVDGGAQARHGRMAVPDGQMGGRHGRIAGQAGQMDARHGRIAGQAGRLEFADVSLQFPGSDRRIVADVALELPAGKTVALVGRVGSGKSWLVNLIPRLVDPSQGCIRLDGRDLREYPLEELRGQIGYVPQEPVLFSDTVRNNLIFGRDGITEERLRWALEISQFNHEVAAFPQGLDTPIGTRGMSISGGQKQRLALARALVTRPRILILDDCTSALDARTETALWEKLHAVMPGTTAILITHRPDSLRRADRIYVLAEGRVIEQGRHDRLIASGGEYARIYRRFELCEAVGLS